MEKTKKNIFKLPILEDFYDYKKSVYFVIFIAYAIVNTLVLSLSSNPMWLKFIVDTPMLFIMLYLFRKVLINDIKIFGKHLKRYIPFVLVGFLITLVLNFIGTNIVIGGIDGSAPNQEAALAAFEQSTIFGVLIMVFAAPIMEELIFRRSIRIMVKNKLLYYFLSVFLFGMAHLIIGFTFPTSFAFILSYALSAIGYIYVYEKSNNIWCPIFTHMLLNAVPVSLIIIML